MGFTYSIGHRLSAKRRREAPVFSCAIVDRLSASNRFLAAGLDREFRAVVSSGELHRDSPSAGSGHLGRGELGQAGTVCASTSKHSTVFMFHCESNYIHTYLLLLGQELTSAFIDADENRVASKDSIDEDVAEYLSCYLLWLTVCLCLGRLGNLVFTLGNEPNLVLKAFRDLFVVLFVLLFVFAPPRNASLGWSSASRSP
jgi:hypothetical protein